jgi:integration host factor subunit beta
VNKSELVSRLAIRHPQLSITDVEFAVKCLMEQMTSALAQGERIAVRGFGIFSLHHRAPKIGRNPKTGEPVTVEAKAKPHFKPGKELKEKVNAAAK